MFGSLLIPIDLSPGSDRVVGRAAMLPLAEGARLTLLHVVPRQLPQRAQVRAERDAKQALAAEAKHLATLVPRGVVVQHVVSVGAFAAEIVSHARSANAELIVMGRGGGRALRDVFLGSTAERVIRQSQLPVLVVRLPARTPYRRPAFAVDLDQAAHDTVAMLLRVIPPPRPQVAIIHAYQAPYHGLVYPSLSRQDAEEYRRHYRHKALQEINELVAAAVARARIPSADAPSWKTHVQYGTPRTIIEKAVEKLSTDLLVLGTHGYAGVAHAFLGTVAGDVLRSVACDVLVVPPRHKARKKP